MFVVNSVAEIKEVKCKMIAFDNDLIRSLTVICAVDSTAVDRMDSALEHMADWYDDAGMPKFREFKILELGHFIRNCDVTFKQTRDDEGLVIQQCDLQKMRFEFKADRRAGIVFQVVKHDFRDGLLDPLTKLVKQTVYIDVVERQMELPLSARA